MSGNKLDQIVKGVPSPVPDVGGGPLSRAHNVDIAYTSNIGSVTEMPANDLLSTLPSSPPQIYVNLLILEASLRSQYLILRGRRRQHTFFLLLLGLWITYSFYALFLRPREDGSGVGGSVYWVVEMAEKMALMGGIVTGILVWGTGQWEHGVRWPRRFVGVANRGLRNINTKIIIIRGPWWKEVLSYISFLFPYPSLFPSQRSSYQYVDSDAEKHHPTRPRALFEVTREYEEEDLEPGGDHIKLLLLPKPFSAEFRENWDLYRSEYWEKENERRVRKRRRIQALDNQLSKEQGRWFWWVGWRRVEAPGVRACDIEKTIQHYPPEPGRKLHHHVVKPELHSRSASWTRAPANPDVEDRHPPNAIRRGTANVAHSERRRKARPADSKGGYRVPKLNPNDALSRHIAASISTSNSANGLSSINLSSGIDSDR